MKKIVLASAALGCMLATSALAHEEKAFDPKAGKHLVVTMEQLSEKGNTVVGEVVAVETLRAARTDFTCIKMPTAARMKKV